MIDTSVFKRYSPKAIEEIREALEKESVEVIWARRNGSGHRP